MRSGFFQSTYTKVAFAVVFGAAGLIAAAFVGRGILDRPSVEATELASGPVRGSSNLDDRYVNFGPGDPFPREPLWDAEGNEDSFQNLLHGRNTLVYFAMLDCEPCAAELRFIQANRSKLRPGVQLIVALWKDAGDTKDLYAGLLQNVPVVYYDNEIWWNRYDMQFWPCLIGVDNSGFVRHIQLGFDGYLDHELVSYFFDANQ